MSSRFLAVHNSGAIVTHGPTQPQTPNKDIATSTEVDMYIRAAMEGETASVATAAWRPANLTNQLKQLQPSPKTGRGKGGYQGRGKGGYRGRGKGGYRGQGKGGYRGRGKGGYRGRGKGGFRGKGGYRGRGRGRGGRGGYLGRGHHTPTSVYNGVHYHRR